MPPAHRRPPRFVLAACALLLIAAIISVGWRWAAITPRPTTVFDGALYSASSKGPVDPAFCGPLQIPLPPPPVDSPYGFHLYAASSKGRVHPLPVMEALALLPPPVHAASEDAALPSQNQTAAPAIATPSLAGAPASSNMPAALPGDYNESAEEDVQTVVLLLEEYRRAFGAMPMGEQNDEIVRRLQGENPKGIAVLPQTHPNLSQEGDLLDRWGTPYRFHPESAWHMTVRSAGPDREMWTQDDIISSESSLPDRSDLTASF